MLLRENERLQDTIQSLVGKLEQLGVNGMDVATMSTRKESTGPKTQTMADNMSSPAPPQARLGDIDPVALGVDFVLA